MASYEPIKNTLNFSVSLKPTTAFPLDARSMFGSYAEAAAAAATAENAGSNNTVYYYGQTLTVFENNIATHYIIQGDNTLSPISGGVSGDFMPNAGRSSDTPFNLTATNGITLNSNTNVVIGINGTNNIKISGPNSDDNTTDTETLTLSAYNTYVKTTALHLENLRSETDGVRIHGVANPTADTDVANKKYVDDSILSLTTNTAFDTVVTDQTSWDNMLISTTAKNILISPTESITFGETVTLPGTAQHIKFSAPGADYFTIPDSGCTIQTEKSTQNLLLENLVQRTNLIINNVAFVEKCQVGTIQNARQVMNCTCSEKYYNIRSAINCVTSSLTYGTFESVQSCTSCYGYKFISCNNLIGCRGSIFESCDTIVLNSKIKTATFTNCTNLIQETNISNETTAGTVKASTEVLVAVDGTMSIGTIGIDKVDGLTDALSSKADKENVEAISTWGSF